jgi:cobalt/nickel transport protein
MLNEAVLMTHQNTIDQITGGTYKPIAKPICESPSAESLLFGLQAAIGAGVIGYFLGFTEPKVALKTSSVRKGKKYAKG